MGWTLSHRAREHSRQKNSRRLRRRRLPVQHRLGLGWGPCTKAGGRYWPYWLVSGPSIDVSTSALWKESDARVRRSPGHSRNSERRQPEAREKTHFDIGVVRIRVDRLGGPVDAHRRISSAPDPTGSIEKIATGHRIRLSLQLRKSSPRHMLAERDAPRRECRHRELRFVKNSSRKLLVSARHWERRQPEQDRREVRLNDGFRGQPRGSRSPSVGVWRACELVCRPSHRPQW